MTASTNVARAGGAPADVRFVLLCEEDLDQVPRRRCRRPQARSQAATDLAGELAPFWIIATAAVPSTSH